MIQMVDLLGCRDAVDRGGEPNFAEIRESVTYLSPLGRWNGLERLYRDKPG